MGDTATAGDTTTSLNSAKPCTVPLTGRLLGRIWRTSLAATEPGCGSVSGVIVLAQLPFRDSTLVLREAEAQDVPFIVELLAADQLGRDP